VNVPEYLADIGRYNTFLRALGHTAHEVAIAYHTVSFGQSTASLRMQSNGRTVELATMSGFNADLSTLVAAADAHGFEIFSPGLNRVIKLDASALDCPNPS